MSDSQDWESLRADAIRALGAVLRAPDAKPADVLRASEAILRAAPDAQGASREAHGLTDAQLLALARGLGGQAGGEGREGGTPRKRGPGDSGAAAVPSGSDADQFPPLAVGGGETPNATPMTRSGPMVPSPNSRKVEKGTQKGPDGTRATPDGTQRGPVNLQPAPQIADDPDPWT